MADRRQTQFTMQKLPAFNQAPPSSNHGFRPPLLMPSLSNQSTAGGRLSYQTSVAPNALRPPITHTLMHHQRSERINLRTQFAHALDGRSSIQSSASRDGSSPRSSVSGLRGPQQTATTQYRTVQQHLVLPSASKQQSAIRGGGGSNITMIGTAGRNNTAAIGVRERVTKEERDISNKQWQQNRMECLIESLKEWGYSSSELNKVNPTSMLASKEFLKIVYFLARHFSPAMHDFITYHFGEPTEKGAAEVPEFIATWRAYSFSKTVGKSHISAISPMSWKNCSAFLDWLHTEIKLQEETAKIEQYLLPNLLHTEDLEGLPLAGLSDEMRRHKLQTRTGLEIGLAKMEEFYQVHAEGGQVAVEQIFGSDEFHALCGQKLNEALGYNELTLDELRKQRDDTDDYITAYKQRPTVEWLRDMIVQFTSTAAKAELDNENFVRLQAQLQQELAQLQNDTEKNRVYVEELQNRIRNTEQDISNQTMNSEEAEEIRRQLEVLQTTLLSVEDDITALDDVLSDLRVEIVRMLQEIGDLVRNLELILFESGALEYFSQNNDESFAVIIKPVMPTGMAHVDVEYSRDYVKNFLLCMQHWEQQLDTASDQNSDALKWCESMGASITAKKLETSAFQAETARIEVVEAEQCQQRLAERQSMLADAARLKAENDQKLADIEAETAQREQWNVQLARRAAELDALKRQNDDAEVAIPGMLDEFSRSIFQRCGADIQRECRELNDARTTLLDMLNQYARKADDIRVRLDDTHKAVVGDHNSGGVDSDVGGESRSG